MLQLIKVEWMKVRNYRTFWVLSTLYIVSIFGANYIGYSLYDSSPKNDPVSTTLIGTPYDFPFVWHTVSFTSSYLMFMLGLLLIISFTNEYSFKTHRQNIIDGISRTEFIGVKMLLTVIVAMAATVIVFATALLFGISQSATGFSFENVQFIGYFFVQALSYCTVALLFSLLFKRSGITIGIYFLYTAILENMMAGILNRYANNIGRYLPLETTDNLIPLPVFKVVVSQFVTSYNVTALLTMSIIYLTLFYYICYRKFNTDDL